MPPVVETFVLPSQYGFEADIMALGNTRTPHGGGIESFGKYDTSQPRHVLGLKFTGIKELSGANLYKGNSLPDLEYLYRFYKDHACAGLKIFSVVGYINGDADTVPRLYTFADESLKLTKFSYLLWSSTVKMIQWGAGDYTIANLPGGSD